MLGRTGDGQTGRLIWAIALILGGLLLLLFNLGAFAIYEPLLQYGLAALLTAGAIGFFGSYISQRGHWWRLIPAWTLLALAGMAYLSTWENLDQRLTAALLFAGQAIAFGHVYLLDRRERWWAIIPGGFMLVLGGVIALSSRTQDPDVLGTVLFLGMGSVFLLLYLLGTRRRLWWALIPGLVLLVFGLLLFSVERTGQNLVLRWWPILLVLSGLALGWQTLRHRRPSSQLTVNSAPNLSRRSQGRKSKGREPPAESSEQLGDYQEPAPGTSIDIIAHPDDE